MWMRSRGPEGEGLVATLYGPSSVSTQIGGVSVKVGERTDYPFGFEIELSIETERELEFPLRLRLPGWSANPEVTAPDAKVSRDARGFLVLNKRWKSGDKARLSLKPAIYARKAVNGKAAMAYGPLVFSLPIPEKSEIVARFP
ncbi:MAG TPA: hypothetical protein VNT26_15590, partial [Candidatus Sulfotelmatobacter sp.]|nr:hypothetical protein [Candidatus Sulfotelmatobacter sp.]